MGRFFEHKRTEKGVRAYEQVLALEKEEFNRVQHEYGEDSLEAANQEMIVAALHYFIEKHDGAEALCLRNLEFTRSRFGPSSSEAFSALLGLMGNYLNQIPDCEDEFFETLEAVKMLQEEKQQDDGPFLILDPITENLYRRSKEYRSSELITGSRAGLILGFLAVSWFVTCFPLAKFSESTMMTQFRDLMRVYGVQGGAWQFIVDRSNQNLSDPIGLLCVLDEMEVLSFDTWEWLIEFRKSIGAA